MKEYLSMADWFDGSVFAIGSNLYFHCENIDSSLVAEFHCNQDAKYAAHAINSHDELVEINKYLLSKLKEIDECFEAAYIDGLSDAFANEDIYTIKDIYCRRIEFARGVAVSAICKENK